MKVSKKTLLAVIAALAVLAIVATGCSGTSSSGGSSGATEIKIGIGAPLTAGATALGQGMERASELAISEANANPDVVKAGIKFVGVPGDDQGNPTVGTTVANTFASDPALVGVMGHLNSGVSIPASKIYNQNKIVQITPASTNPQLTQQGFNNVFRTCTIDSVQGPAGANAAIKLGYKSAYVIDDSTPYGTGLAQAWSTQFAAKGGKVLGTEKTTDNQTDFSAVVTKIKAANPDVVYYGGIYNAGAPFLKQLRQAGVKAAYMGGDGLYDPTFVSLATTASAEGAYATSVGLPLDQLPKGQEFKAAYNKAYPGKEIAAYDAYAFDATNVIIDAVLKAVQDPSVGVSKITGPDGRSAIIANVAKTNTTGVTGPISFDTKGDTNNKAITLYKVTNGAWGAVAQASAQ